MDEPDAVSPPVPAERTASPAFLNAGCIVACGLALLPVFYVGSFAFLLVDDLYGWRFLDSLDDRTTELVVLFYSPLIRLLIAAGLLPAP